MDKIWDLTKYVIEDFWNSMDEGKPLKDSFVDCKEKIFEEVRLPHWEAYKQMI